MVRLEINNIYEGMTPKEKEIFIAAYPIFSREILPLIKEHSESKGFGPKKLPTQEQQNEMMVEIMPTLFSSINKMLSTVGGTDMLILMNAISKGVSNMQKSGVTGKEDLNQIIDKSDSPL